MAADRWLPKLSDLLSLARRTYPVLVLGVPSTFDMSINGEDVRGIIDSNNEFIEHLSVVQHVEFLPHRRTQAASRENCVLIIPFADPTTANCCINRHVILRGRLLPTVKYVHRPPPMLQLPPGRPPSSLLQAEAPLRPLHGRT